MHIHVSVRIAEGVEPPANLSGKLWVFAYCPNKKAFLSFHKCYSKVSMLVEVSLHKLPFKKPILSLQHWSPGLSNQSGAIQDQPLRWAASWNISNRSNSSGFDVKNTDRSNMRCSKIVINPKWSTSSALLEIRLTWLLFVSVKPEPHTLRWDLQTGRKL